MNQNNTTQDKPGVDADPVSKNRPTEIQWPVIDVYRRNDAIEDGLLVDLMQGGAVEEVCRQHYKYPVACTVAVWELLTRAVENKEACNDYAGILHDIFFLARQSWSQTDNTTTVMPKVIITGLDAQIYYRFKIVCGPADDGSPCLTLMLPEEE